MALTDPHAPGATPLSPEDLEGLKLPATTHGELNELEAANIRQGQEWALRARSTRIPDMLSDQYVRRLHKQMYGEVWAWAGQYRRSDKNIGVTHTTIWPELRVVYEDARYWIEHGGWAPDEVVIRLHHRLVKVHPFPNGNGRHARMMADLVLLRHFRAQRLPWGGNTLGNADPRRRQYITALQAADGNDYGPLLEFCRSSS
ncbi:MAG TPA: mobile mystery protein B [Candidatus Sulfotelmatobacter sp.]|nr:mobile mystery protein B [Candidatus Sulfotelmatobacter sp.]